MGSRLERYRCSNRFEAHLALLANPASEIPLGPTTTILQELAMLDL